MVSIMITQVVYIMGMWSVLADRKSIEMLYSVQYQRYVLMKENAWLIFILTTILIFYYK